MSARAATARAHSMKSLAVGPSVRFLSVVMATGCTEGGSAQGSTLSTLCALPPKRRTEAGMMARKRPVASKLVRTLSD